MNPLILQHSSKRREYTFSEPLIPYYKLQWVSAGHFRERKISIVGRNRPSPATPQPPHRHRDEGRQPLAKPVQWWGRCLVRTPAPMEKLHKTQLPLSWFFSLPLKNTCEVNVLHLIKTLLWLWGHLTKVGATPCHQQHPAWKAGARQPCRVSYYQVGLSQRLHKMTSV